MNTNESLDTAFIDLYPEVHRIAKGALRRGVAPWQGDQTLDTTALVHEAFIKLSANDSLRWSDRGHFLALVASTMRYVLVDYARSRTRVKRGSQSQRISFEDAALMSESLAEEVLAIDQALTTLASHQPRLARVVECRFILGLSLEETAEAIGVSSMTVKRDWLSAKALLGRLLSSTNEPTPQTDV